MKEKETIFEKLGRIITMAGTAVLMNLLFLVPFVPPLLTAVILGYFELLGSLGGKIGLIVSCLPLLLVGQNWCALTSAIRYNIRGDSWFAGYKAGFKARFWRGTIAWCVMLAAAAYLMLDLNHVVGQGFYQEGGINTAYITPLVGASLMFALVGMLTVALLMLNVYIPTKPMDWLRNAANMVFRYPLQLLFSAVLFWLPVVLGVLWFDIFYMAALIFVAAYFTLASLGCTMLLKEALIDYLTDARADGTLLSEEGKQKVVEEEEADDEDETEDEE